MRKGEEIAGENSQTDFAHLRRLSQTLQDQATTGAAQAHAHDGNEASSSRAEREGEFGVRRRGAAKSGSSLVRDVQLSLQQEIDDDRASGREARGERRRQALQQQARIHLHGMRPRLRSQGDPEIALCAKAHAALRLLVRALRKRVQDQGRPDHAHPAESSRIAGDMRRVRQDLPEQPQSLHSSEARALQSEIRVSVLPSATRHAGESRSARADAAREEGEVGVRGVRQDLLRELRFKEAHENPHGRQAVHLLDLRPGLRPAQQPQSASASAHRRAYLRVRRVRQVVRSEGRSYLPQEDPFGHLAAIASNTYRPHSEGVYQEMRGRIKTSDAVPYFDNVSRNSVLQLFYIV